MPFIKSPGLSTSYDPKQTLVGEDGNTGVASDLSPDSPLTKYQRRAGCHTRLNATNPDRTCSKSENFGKKTGDRPSLLHSQENPSVRMVRGLI